MLQSDSFYEFKAESQKLPDEAGVLEEDRLDDLYGNLTSGLKSQLMVSKFQCCNHFQLFCDLAGGVNNDLKRLSLERANLRFQKISNVQPPSAPNSVQPSSSRASMAAIPVPAASKTHPITFFPAVIHQL